MTFSEQLIALKTITVREFLRFFRLWIQTLVPPIITMTLYFIIFGQLIGSQIGDIDGYSYMDYIVPGLILMTVISNSYANVVSSFFGAKFHRNIEEMIISPVPNYIILLGYISGGVARGVMIGIIVTFISTLFSDFQIHSIAISLAVFVLTSILFSLAGLINGVFAQSFDDITVIPSFVLTPLTYLGGIFYSIKILPEFWQTVSMANPILYMVNAFRYGLLGISDINITSAFIIIVAFIVVMFAFVLTLLNKGIGIKP